MVNDVAKTLEERSIHSNTIDVMKKKNLFAILMLVLVLAGCNGDAEKGKENEKDTAASDTAKIVQAADNPADTLFHLSFIGESDREVKAKISKSASHVHVNFKTPSQGKLTALIIPADSSCNIRINQIIMPGNKSDGPFGKEHSFLLSKAGVYRLIIGQNMMAGNTDGCEFTLKLNFK